jgi:[protein-PII] uridylyltransferase
LREWLKRQPLAGIGADEVEAHFEGMPAHYWDNLAEGELVWGLSTIHTFLGKITRSNVPPTLPILDWQHSPESDSTRLMLCTWDRRGLLAKAAACLSAVELNIEQARAFTRADQIVLDLLLIRDQDAPGRASDEKLKRFGFLLDGALSSPPRFASVWACSRHQYLESPRRAAPWLSFDNRSSSSSTLLRIRTPDRMGLLYDILNAIAEAGANLQQADVRTQGALARDTFHVVDGEGRKLTDPQRLREIRRSLKQALGGEA